jgi:hypothetical protein
MTAHADEQRPVSLQLTPGSDRFDPNDVRWARQVDGLWRALEEQAGVVQRSIVQVPGKKGGVDVIILALGSAGAISAAVEVIRMWLGRPPRSTCRDWPASRGSAASLTRTRSRRYGSSGGSASTR